MKKINDKTVRVGIGVLVINGERKILLGKRKNAREQNTFALPGGHLEFGESFEECAKRELKEETNLDRLSFETVSLANDVVYEKHYVTIGLLVKNFKGELKLMESDKCESWAWYDKNILPKPSFGPSEKIIENYFSGNFYQS